MNLRPIRSLQPIGVRLVKASLIFSRMRAFLDLAYGPAPWQRLDIYRPPGRGLAKLPVLVFFHGGRWSFGSRDMYGFVGDAFARRGYVTVVPDYSKYPQVRFPAFVKDGAKALSFISERIADYGGDPGRIVISGHSAGAHIAALLTADRSYLAEEGKDRNAVIRGFAGLAGPYDFTPDAPDLEDIFGPPERYPLMRATTFIDGTEPPMLLLHGGADTVVKLENLKRLESRIRERGGMVKSIIYPRIGHMWIMGALSRVNFVGPWVREDMLAFFDKVGEAAGADASPLDYRAG